MQYRVKWLDNEDLWLEFPGDSACSKYLKSDAYVFETLAEAAGETARLEREHKGCDYCVVPVIKRRG